MYGPTDPKLLSLQTAFSPTASIPPVWHASPSWPTRGHHMTPDDQGMGSIPYGHPPKWPPGPQSRGTEGRCFQPMGVLLCYYYFAFVHLP